MQIILNGKSYQIGERITLHELINEVKCTNTNFAIAVNLTMIPRSRYHETWLQENDKVEIVSAFQGG
jgi:thiamine biosynthesis protein ThiS